MDGSNKIVITIKKETAPIKTYWFSRYWELIVGFVLLSWPPFFGYIYFNAYLSGIGFEGFYVNLNIQESILYFLKGTVGIWEFNLIFNYSNVFIALMISVFVLIISISGWRWREDLKRIWPSLRMFMLTDYSYDTVGSIKSCFFSFFKSVLSFIFVMSVPVMFWGAMTIAFLMAIIADPLGENDGVELLQTERCIYPRQGMGCAEFKIGDEYKAGYLVYGSEKASFIINKNGRYVIGVKGNIIFHKPFENPIYESISNEDFDVLLWANDPGARPKMLFDIKNKYLDKVKLNDFRKYFGVSDSKGSYLYPEFPSYKLSDDKNCTVVFPFNWDNNLITDMRFFGDCKGVIST